MNQFGANNSLANVLAKKTLDMNQGQTASEIKASREMSAATHDHHAGEFGPAINTLKNKGFSEVKKTKNKTNLSKGTHSINIDHATGDWTHKSGESKFSGTSGNGGASLAKRANKLTFSHNTN